MFNQNTFKQLYVTRSPQQVYPKILTGEFGLVPSYPACHELSVEPAKLMKLTFQALPEVYWCHFALVVFHKAVICLPGPKNLNR